MICRNCGNQISDQAAVCPHCGSATGVAQQPYYGAPQQPYYGAQQQPYYGAPQQPYYGVQPEEKSTLATCAIVFAFLMPIVGLILGIVGLVKCQDPSNRNKCIAAIPLSIVVWFICFLILL